MAKRRGADANEPRRGGDTHELRAALHRRDPGSPRCTRARQARGALETAADRAIDLRDFLVATHTVEDDKVVRALADEVGMEFVEKIAAETIPEDLDRRRPHQLRTPESRARAHQTDESVRVAIANPLDPFPSTICEFFSARRSSRSRHRRRPSMTRSTGSTNARTKPPSPRRRKVRRSRSFGI